jgi:hypothetical protein
MEGPESRTPTDCFAFVDSRRERPILTFVGGWNGLRPCKNNFLSKAFVRQT